MQVDSLSVQTQDTISQIVTDSLVTTHESVQIQSVDTIQEQKQTTSTPIRVIPTQTQNRTIIAPKKEQTTVVSVDSINQETVLESKESCSEEYSPFSLFSNLRLEDSSIYKVKYTSTLVQPSSELKKEMNLISRNTEKSTEKGWVFGIAIVSTLLLIIIRVYFQKYLTTVIVSSVNFQLADKLIREKNILVRRVFIILNINFLVSASLYIYLIVKRIGINTSQFFDFSLYLFIFALLFSILFIRIIILNIVAGLFDSRPLFKEFIHNTYLLNKNLGLYLLPMVVSIFYLPRFYSEIVFYMATVLVVFSFIYRYLRSLQIILKHKVLYFYTILYLCTLEILPALVGIKFVLSLR